MSQPDFRYPLQRIVILPAESFTPFRRPQQAPYRIKQSGDLGAGRDPAPFGEFIKAGYIAGQRPQPCKPGIPQHQLKKFSVGRDAAMDPLIRQPLRVQTTLCATGAVPEKDC